MAQIRAIALALALSALSALPAASAAAQDIVVNATLLDQARAAGEVGERNDGYLGVVKESASAEVRAQVGKTNIKRRALYGDLAVRRGVTRHDVALAAGCQTLARVAAGEYYWLGDGQWRRRAVGDPAPRPGYCG